MKIILLVPFIENDKRTLKFGAKQNNRKKFQSIVKKAGKIFLAKGKEM
jgi:hypothetical protein